MSLIKMRANLIEMNQRLDEVKASFAIVKEQPDRLQSIAEANPANPVKEEVKEAHEARIARLAGYTNTGKKQQRRAAVEATTEAAQPEPQTDRMKKLLAMTRMSKAKNSAPAGAGKK